jgi:predicted HicB family RNase H-like nuclease
MSIMTYKGYAARIELDPDDRFPVGHVAGIRDTIGFHGSTELAGKSVNQWAAEVLSEAATPRP